MVGKRAIGVLDAIMRDRHVTADGLPNLCDPSAGHWPRHGTQPVERQCSRSTGSQIVGGSEMAQSTRLPRPASNRITDQYRNPLPRTIVRAGTPAASCMVY